MIPVLPPSAPFTPEQRAWLNGYFAGLFQTFEPTPLGTRCTPTGGHIPQAPATTLLFLYGTQTGTAESLCHKMAKTAKAKGFAPKVMSLSDYTQIDWRLPERMLVVTSTYGDGEPPDNATDFWQTFGSESAPRLGAISYSVLALGDTNYAGFCAFGKTIDARWHELGAHRLAPRVDCDVDYEKPAEEWLQGVLEFLGSASPSTAVVSASDLESPPLPEYSKSHPFSARLLTNRLLTGNGSAKETRHFEISLAGSGLSYEVGDALGLIPQNCPELVEAILSSLGLDGEEAVSVPEGGERPLRLALLKSFDLKKLEESWPPKTSSAQELIAGLKKIAPRLYSISSSLKAHPDQVHLTVSIVRYETAGQKRKGVASTFLADRVGPETPVPVFLHQANHFRLPKALDTPIIMVGPGTGVAPFRAFLEERESTGATGKNWLFFGDQKSSTDFLYQDEIERWQKSGHLTRLSTAFSRDQSEKVYVQHRMSEAAHELWSWLEEGAYFYVCGDASRMAKDVDLALHQLCESAGGLSSAEAADYVKKLKSDKRYARDVY